MTEVRHPSFTSNPRIPFAMSTERRELPPPIPGKPLIVHIVVAMEHWAYDQPIPRTILSAPHGASSVPDVPNWSWAEYGMRCGMPRLFRVLGERNIRVDACINADVIDVYPGVAARALELGWEFQGHGIHQKAMPEASEEELVLSALDKLQAFTGYRPKGWIGPGLKESNQTVEILKRSGVVYTCDWVVDDLPTWIHTDEGLLVAVPYTLELNDSVIFAVEKHSSDEQYNRLRHTLEAIEPELVLGPRVLTISLHHHLNGVLHRIVFLEKMLDTLLARNDTVFMTGTEIADWFIDIESDKPGTRSS